MNRRLNQLYESVGYPGSFGGVQPLRDAMLDGEDEQVPSFEAISNSLSGMDSYTLHKQKRRPRVFNPIRVYEEDDLLQIDLVELQELAEFNDNVRYLLCAINTLTRKAYVRPLRDKTTLAVTREFNDILDSIQAEHGIQMRRAGHDRGAEFVSAAFQANLRTRNMKSVLMRKAYHCERYQRSLQSMLHRYMSSKQTYRYIDVLEDIVKSLNNRRHRIIRMTPEQASMPENKPKLLAAVSDYYAKAIRRRKKPVFKPGDLVRVENVRTPFEKGYRETQSRKIFKIKSVLKNLPIPKYRLSSLDGKNTLFGSFYADQLQRVDNPDQVFKVQKVLKERKRGGKKELLVRWWGYGEDDDSWIDARDIVTTY